MSTLTFESDDSVLKAVKELLADNPSDALFEAIEWVQLRARRGLTGTHMLYCPSREPLHIEAWLKL